MAGHTTDTQRRSPVPHLAVAHVAAGQRGLITHRQLLACGLTDRQVRHAAGTGRLFRVHVGVYAVGVPPTTFEVRCLAAILAVAGSVLSHGTAATVLGFSRSAPARPHVVVERGGGRVREGVVVHRTGRLHPRDHTVLGDLPVTTGPRTLLDRAAQVGRRRLEAELATARVRGLAPDDQVRAVIARNPRRAGGPALAAALLGPFTRSELERRLLLLVDEEGLPAPQVNAMIGGDEVDFVWPNGLVVELDGRAAHGVTAAIARDAAKDERLRARGMRVLRFTWWDVVRDPRRTAATLRDAL